MKYTLNSWHVDFANGVSIDLMSYTEFKSFAFHAESWTWGEIAGCFTVVTDEGRTAYVWPHYEGLQEGRYF